MYSTYVAGSSIIYYIYMLQSPAADMKALLPMLRANIAWCIRCSVYRCFPVRVM